MSRSRKKAIAKDGNGAWKQICRRKVKRHQRTFLKANLQEILDGEKAIPNDKVIVNDYDYSDYRYDLEHRTRPICRRNLTDEKFREIKEKLSRK